MSTTFGPLATFVFDTRKGMNLTSPVDCVKRNVMDVNSTNEQVQVRIEIWGGDAKDNLTGGQTAMFCDVEGIPVGIRTHGFDQYRNPVVAPLSLYMHFGAAFQDYVPGVEPAFPSWNGFNVVGFKISCVSSHVAHHLNDVFSPYFSRFLKENEHKLTDEQTT